MFNRVTGQPIWPIEERPVPQSDVPGEQSSPTQPFPTRPAPFSRLKFTEADVNPYLDEAERARIIGILRNARNEGIFTPLSITKDQISVPGELGGANWGGAAADPETGMLYVRSADQPALHTPLQPVETSAAIDTMAPQPRYTGRLGTMFFAANGMNAMSPPWAQITAYDLNTGDIKWKAPLGVVPSLAAKGITEHGQQLSRAPQRPGRHRRRIDLHRAFRRSHGSRVRQGQRQDSVGKEDDPELRGHPGGV